VELGANDGINQSNTLYFEKNRGWKGVLVEPILHNFLACKLNRSAHTKVFCNGCVSFGYKKKFVDILYSNLMSIPVNLESDITKPEEHALLGKQFLPLHEENVLIGAVAKTLNSLLIEADAPNEIDLLSLDVEGAEIEVLKGINFSKFSFKFIIVENRNFLKIKKYLERKGYEYIDKLSDHDYLFKLKIKRISIWGRVKLFVRKVIGRLIRSYFISISFLSALVTRGIYKVYGLRLGQLRQFSPKKLKVGYFLKKDPPKYKGNLRLTVVIPNLNQGIFIDKTIASILDQNFANLELIIQDGGSTDGSLEVIHKFKNRIDYFCTSKDNGQANAINAGFKKSTGDIMAWINSDDIYLPGAFDHVMSIFEAYPDIDVIYGNRLLIDSAGRHIGNWVIPYHDEEALIWADYIPQETLFWRRSVWNNIGANLDETFQFALDWDLLLRLKKSNANFLHTPYFLGCFRIHEEQKSSACVSSIGINEMNRIRMSLHGRIPSEEEIHKKLKKFFYWHKMKDLGWRIRLNLPFFS
jgi:FkbM family methyltransferase